MSEIKINGISVNIYKIDHFWVDMDIFKTPRSQKEDLIQLFNPVYRQKLEKTMAKCTDTVGCKRNLGDNISILYWSNKGDVSVGCSIKHINELLQVFADETLKTEIIREAFKHV